MKIYKIDCSARKKGSVSRHLSKLLLERIKKKDDKIVVRDLDDEMLFVAGLSESGMSIPERDRTDEHKKMFELSDKLVNELEECDTLIISTPIYNFGPPATLKAWADLTARAKSNFKYLDNGERVGLLEDKNVFLIITSGGTIVKGKEDFLTPWLITTLNMFGIKNIKLITADKIALDKDNTIKQAENIIDKIKLY